MWLKLKICFGYAILVLLLAFIVYQFRKEQVLRHMLRKEEKELAAIHSLAIIRKSKFPQNPKRSVRFSGKRTKRSVQKRKARNTQKAETKVL